MVTSLEGRAVREPMEGPEAQGASEVLGVCVGRWMCVCLIFFIIRYI